VLQLLFPFCSASASVSAAASRFRFRRRGGQPPNLHLLFLQMPYFLL
jgi:hypothetical protein